MPKNNKNTIYPEYIIYKLCCDNTDLFYIGSTRDFTTRKSVHKCGCNNSNNERYNYKVYKNMREFGGWNEWRMVVIEILNDVTKLQAEMREEVLRVELKALLNSQKASCGGITSQEYKAEYWQENKEQLKEKQKVTTDCECGITYTHSNKARHCKSKKHIRYLEQKE